MLQSVCGALSFTHSGALVPSVILYVLCVYVSRVTNPLIKSTFVMKITVQACMKLSVARGDMATGLNASLASRQRAPSAGTRRSYQWFTPLRISGFQGVNCYRLHTYIQHRCRLQFFLASYVNECGFKRCVFKKKQVLFYLLRCFIVWNILLFWFGNQIINHHCLTILIYMISCLP